MTEQLILMGIQLALTILRSENLKPKEMEIGLTLLNMFSKARSEYEAEKGQPLDMSKLRPFESIP
jgi:hypothetical protein